MFYPNNDCPYGPTCGICYPSNLNKEWDVDKKWTKVIQADLNRQARRAETTAQLYAYKPEVEFEIEKVLWNLIHGTAYTEKEGLYEKLSK